MSRKRKLSNIKERCRICLVDNGCMSDLFDEVLQSKLNDLTKCTSINVCLHYFLFNSYSKFYTFFYCITE